MGLQSTVFGFKGDAALEACLVKDEAHIKQGVNGVGGHVLKIQQALTTLDRLAISPDEIRKKTFGQSTAAAVLKFKQKRRIINFSYQTQADNIVGKMTIAAMDKELANRFPFQPIDPLVFPPDVPVPPPPPPSPTSTHFRIRFLGGISAAVGLAGDVLFLRSQVARTFRNLGRTFQGFFDAQACPGWYFRRSRALDFGWRGTLDSQRPSDLLHCRTCEWCSDVRRHRLYCGAWSFLYLWLYGTSNSPQPFTGP
jgi:hypothetical protein